MKKKQLFIKCFRKYHFVQPVHVHYEIFQFLINAGGTRIES